MLGLTNTGCAHRGAQSKERNAGGQRSPRVHFFRDKVTKSSTFSWVGRSGLTHHVRLNMIILGMCPDTKHHLGVMSHREGITLV